MADFVASRDVGLNNTVLRVIPGMRDVPRDPPRNIAAEKAVIGAGLIDNKLFLHADIEPEHFFEGVHEEIFEKARGEVRAGRSVDAITLCSVFDDADREVAPGTTLRQYLGSLTACAPTTINLDRYADVTRQEAARRKFIVGLEDALKAAWERPASEIAELADSSGKYMLAVREVAVGRGASELFYLASEAAEEAERAPLIDRVLALGTAAILIAPWQAGKTFVLVGMGYAIALGRPFMGRATTQGAVLFVPLEGQSGLAKRLRAANRSYGDPGKSIGVLKGGGSLGPQPGSEAFVSKIITAAKAVAAKAQQPIRLVIIDTLAKALSGADENAAATMSAVWSQAARITAETGATVLFTHHPPHGDPKRPRGTGDIMGGADEVLLIERDGDVRELHSIKQRDEATGLLCRFTLPVVQLGPDARGHQITTCVLQQCDAEPSRTKEPKRPRAQSAAGRALGVLEHLIIDGRCVEARGLYRIPDGAKCVLIDEWRDGCRQERLSEKGTPESEDRTFRRTKTELSAANLIAFRGGHVWLVGQVANALTVSPKTAQNRGFVGSADKRISTGQMPDTSADGHGQSPIKGDCPVVLSSRAASRRSGEGRTA